MVDINIGDHDNFFTRRQDKFFRMECGENIKEQEAREAASET